MRVAALILGIIGGIIGLFAAGAALFIGAVGTATGAEQAGGVVGGGWAALALSVVGIIGGALAMAKPRAAAVLMLIAAIGGFISVFIAYVVAGPLLLVGAMLAYVGNRKAPAATASATAVPTGEQPAAPTPPARS
jgi:hypothetical protein